MDVQADDVAVTPMPKPYASLSTRAQVARLKPIGMRFCDLFGIEGARLRLLNHGFNTTFGVVSSFGERFALRINVNSFRGRAEIGAELAWVGALAQDTDLRVPTPRAGLGEIESEEFGKTVYGALYSWLPGPTGDSVPIPEVARAVGEATMKLHNHARGWTFPEGCRFHPARNVTFGAELRFKEHGFAGDIGVMEEVQRMGNGVLDRLRTSEPIPIHYDLHLANVKWHRGKLAVFDFDDAILGYPAMDVAVSLFYLRRYANAPEMEAAYRSGLGQPIEAFGFSEADCETLVAARGLGLANELYAMNTAELIELAPRYAALTEIRLKHFLKTGRFDSSVASLS
jgi:Ser/Thr protein kinase RdoA (MazF antagonist)